MSPILLWEGPKSPKGSSLGIKPLKYGLSRKPSATWDWTHKPNFVLTFPETPSHYRQWSCGLSNLKQHDAFFHHYQGSIDFNIVNIHPTIEMYFFVSTGNRDDVEGNDQQRSSCPIPSLLPGVYGSILSLGTVFLRTLPREDTGTHPHAENIDNVPAKMH